MLDCLSRVANTAARGRGAAGLMAAMMGLVAAPAAAQAATGPDWPQFGRSAKHLNANPRDTTFNPGNVAGLRVAWQGHFGDNTTTEGGAVMAGDTFYVAGFDGRLSAFPAAGCGTASCEPLWQGRTRNDITSTPAVADGVVFVASADHFLHAFDAAGCGQALCAPLWKGRLADASIDSSVAVADGVVYLGDYGGALYAFAAAGCGAAVCQPLWTGQAGPNEQLLSSPAVGHGHVYIGSTISTPDDFTGRLLVFPVGGCGLPPCAPSWTADIGGPAGRTSSAMLVGDTVFIGSSRRFGGPNSDDHLLAFAAAGCGKAVCTPLRSFDVGPDGIDTTPAWSDGVLFASTQASPSLNTVGVVAAFDAVGCARRRCQPIWTGINFTEGFMSSPVVAGGVVFVGKGPVSGIDIDAGVLAFDAAGCGAIKCPALSLTVPGPTQFYLGAPLSIAHGRISFVSTDNTDGHSNLTILSLP